MILYVKALGGAFPMAKALELPGDRGGGRAIPLLADGHPTPYEGFVFDDGAGGGLGGGELDDAIEGVVAEGGEVGARGLIEEQMLNYATLKTWSPVHEADHFFTLRAGNSEDRRS